jgi:hypothetical protein
MEKTQIKELDEQTRRAFDFVQKLYHEVSYMIREVESALADEEEKFKICKPGGYSISTFTSRGLEPVNVNNWMLRRLSVCFVPEDSTEIAGGSPKTELTDGLKAFSLRVVLDEKDMPPTVFSGVLFNFEKKHSGYQKLEKIIGHIEYRAYKTFKDISKIEYEDNYCKFSGKLLHKELFSINSSEDIQKHILLPALELYRSIK